MKIAIVGSGISGMVAAHLLHRDHDITVFEANDYVGGHTNTIPVECNGRKYDVDTGFIVFNEQTYPSFIRLLHRLDVPTHRTEMSFSVRCERTGLEYNGASLRKLFIQPRNLLRPSFHRMVLDILRFYREAPSLLGTETCAELSQGSLLGETLGEYLRRGRYSKSFIEHHILPMGAAIWSTPAGKMLDFPACNFVRFMANHGFLQTSNRPQWRVITGGSQRYVERLILPYRDRIRLSCPVASVMRADESVLVQLCSGEVERFDAIVFATHSDQALRLLANPTDQEREILGAIPYQRNDVVLHTDTSLLPRDRRAWASWNYHILEDGRDAAALTYNMNILQGLDAPEQFCVTLNRPDAVDPRRILRRITYHHPVFTAAGMAAQRRLDEINGRNRTYFCGAYWGYGFHEDGVRSALVVGRHFDQQLGRPIREADATGSTDGLGLPPPTGLTHAPPEGIEITT